MRPYAVERFGSYACGWGKAVVGRQFGQVCRFRWCAAGRVGAFVFVGRRLEEFWWCTNVCIRWYRIVGIFMSRGSAHGGAHTHKEISYRGSKRPFCDGARVLGNFDDTGGRA